ncbi:MAG: hypothetical protein AB7F19_02460 [Candidatus Babeliales bacterium]
MHPLFKKVIIIALVVTCLNSQNSLAQPRFDAEQDNMAEVKRGLSLSEAQERDQAEREARNKKAKEKRKALKKLDSLFQDYTWNIKTTFYISKCDYIHEILDEAAKLGLTFEDVMESAQRNQVLYAAGKDNNTLLMLLASREDTETPEDTEARFKKYLNKVASALELKLAERARLIGKLVCECRQQRSLHKEEIVNKE